MRMLSLTTAALVGIAALGCDRVDSGTGVGVDAGRPNSDMPPAAGTTQPRTAPATRPDPITPDPNLSAPAPLTPGSGATGTGVPRAGTSTAPGTTADTTPPPGTPPDNTAVNQRDADMRKTKTPIDQDEDQASVDITAKIRSRVREQDNFSVNANNIKIITGGGMTTLRGPVNSQTEHDTIVRIAKEVAGEGKVVNELEVKPQDR